MTKLPRPSAIIFDWDNTLVDTWPTIHKALNLTMRHMNHPEWSLQKVKTDVKKSMRDSFPELFGDRWQEATTHYQQSYLSLHLEDLHPLPGAEETLRAVPKDIFVAIVSNKKGPTLRKEVAHMGWSGLFAAMVGAEDAKRDKPHPDPVHMALEKFTPGLGNHVWFVGDSMIDLECAAATGATPILFGDHTASENQFEGFFFAAHARDHAALRKLILKNL